MRVLYNLLDTAVAYGVFKYHPKCKRINLTNLCFVDELLIFTKGDLDSVFGIKKVLELFYSFSGLRLNYEKSELFTTSVNRAKVERIQ